MEAPDGTEHTDSEGKRWLKRNGQWMQLGQTKETMLPAPMAEFAGAANRSIANIADFYTTSPINTIGGLMGIDAKLPTFGQGMEAATGGTSGFMEPGLARDVTQAAGEWAPAFAAPIRGVAPSLQGGKRQAGQLLEEAAPSIDDLSKRARSLYEKVDELHGVVPQKQIAGLTDDIVSSMEKLGMDPDISPKAYAAAQRMVKDSNAELTLGKLETLRRVAGGAAKDMNPHESMLGGIMQRKIDDFVMNLSDDVLGGSKAGETLRQARKLTQQRKKSETIETLIELAEEQTSGFENGLRLQFRGLLRKIIKGQEKGWTKDEIEALRKVARGGRLENVSKAIGKFGVSEGGSSPRMLIPGMGAGIGAWLGGTIAGAPGAVTGAVTTMAVGNAFRNLASRLTQQNARLASAVARSGPNGRQIVSAYMKSVPKAKQSSAELASLLYSGRVPLPAIEILKKSENAFVANAAFMTAIAAEEAQNQQEEPPLSADGNAGQLP